ncbi:hypothetical protein J0H58_13460 [bacterium]|mgnify:CR=1 FL=1|nr:hypothetical protein [bacterium]
MLMTLKWLLVLLVLGIELCAACNGVCCEIVVLCVLEGLAAGVAHGLVVVLALMEQVRDPAVVTVRRAVAIVRHDARIGLVSGLLIGLTYALVKLLT